jgi:hypothetical protein
MTFLTISTEELAGLAFSSGVGSIGLSGTIYFYRFWGTAEPVSVAFGFSLATAIAAYLYFGGLVRRIRKRSDLSAWRIFGE